MHLTVTIFINTCSHQNVMHDSIENYMQQVGMQARQASRVLTSASTHLKNHALSAIYTALEKHQALILSANHIAIENGRPLPP